MVLVVDLKGKFPVWSLEKKQIHDSSPNILCVEHPGKQIQLETYFASIGKVVVNMLEEK